MIVIAWIFFLLGISRILLANRNLQKIFVIHDTVRENNWKVGGVNYLEKLPQDIAFYSVFHTIMMIFFIIWVIGGWIWSDANSQLFMIATIVHLFSGKISRMLERKRVVYAIWYSLYWGLFTIFTANIIGLLNFLN